MLISLLAIVNTTAPLVAVVLCSTVAEPMVVRPSRTLKLDDDVKTGAVVSVTLTVLVAVPAFPEASVAV